jgi:2-C-methyl-D-erythritol 4-phosphate cytidylyltransferase
MGAEKPKQYLDIGGKSIAQQTVELFLDLPEVVVVCEPEWQEQFGGVTFATPGDDRQGSVRSGLRALSSEVKWVIIHDAVRPFLSPELLAELIAATQEHGAATVATPVRYSVKEIDADGFVAGTLDRKRVWEVQTPQGSRRDWLEQGFVRGEQEGWQVTDEATLIERLGHPVRMVQGSARNLKITTPEDLLLARQLVEQ